MSRRALIHDDFMLENEAARRLYHGYAERMPIVDYHCHLPPAQIAGDHRYRSITEIWLGGDHYKWRAMRSNGIAERYCTGEASDWEKFQKWAETMPRLLGNPLYHWTHLELARYFGLSDTLLGPDTARVVFDVCNAKVAEPGFSARGLMKQSNVRLVCTTDDPTDSLEHHRAIAADASFRIRVLPTWRPDKALAVDDPAAFNAWVDTLAASASMDIGDYDTFMVALARRHDFFHSVGCRLSDHGLETIYAEDFTAAGVRKVFAKVRAGKRPTPRESVLFKSALLHEFGLMDHAKAWVQQFHLGALRNNNSRCFAALGPDTGFDSIGDAEVARPLSRFLDRLDRDGRLARTVLYNLNPRDNEVLATMIGNFQDGSVPGKMQFGSGWWFLDQRDGMERHLEALSQLSLLSRFVGMLTDSRSFLSFTRHEYFRRILCNRLGREMEKGWIPADCDLVGEMVKDICYRNAVRYFGFDLPLE